MIKFQYYSKFILAILVSIGFEQNVFALSATCPAPVEDQACPSKGPILFNGPAVTCYGTNTDACIKDAQDVWNVGAARYCQIWNKKPVSCKSCKPNVLATCDLHYGGLWNPTGQNKLTCKVDVPDDPNKPVTVSCSGKVVCLTKCAEHGSVGPKSSAPVADSPSADTFY